jgi:hypothetical protein
MPETISRHHATPSLWSLYARVLRNGTRADSTRPEIPPLQAELIGARTEPDCLRRYASVCGFREHSRVPITWPHVLAFPLHLELLTADAFPLPLLGLVHLRNRIHQYRPMASGECPDIQARLANQTRTDKGIEFDLITEVFSSGRLIWEEVSTNLYRQPSGDNGSRDKDAANKTSRPAAPEPLPNIIKVTTRESLGRRYGRVSGDLNPIHMHSLSAKAFGFPRAIIHGMWSKAHCIALLEQEPDWQTGPVSVTASFKKPLFLPGTAQLNWQGAPSGGKRWPYQLLNAKGDAPHLMGEVIWD